MKPNHSHSAVSALKSKMRNALRMAPPLPSADPAAKYAPYEYYTAREHLWKAREEAAAADYGDAIDFADVAEEYADKAITLAKQAHEGAGR